MSQGCSTVLFTGSFPQILWSLQRSYLPIQPFVGSHAVWYVSYQSLSPSWHTDLDYGSYRLVGLTAGVTGQHGMVTPLWHLIPLMIFTEVRVRPFSWFFFYYGTYKIDYCSLFLSFHLGISIQEHLEIVFYTLMHSSIPRRRIRVRKDSKVTDWGGPSDETGKTEAPCHSKDPSLLKGPERRA
jgi:hypothetical protein